MGVPKTIQGHSFFSVPSELVDKTILLKTAHILATWYRDSKLDLSWKIPFDAKFLVYDDVVLAAEEEKTSATMLPGQMIPCCNHGTSVM